MGSGKMGRHWSTKEGREISTVREIEGEQKEVSKMRATCKSHTDDKRRKRRAAVRRKRQAQNTGPKPTNVSTFTKRKKVMGGGYMGRSIKGEYGGVNLSNPSYVKYYKGMINV
jgi:hypothetical protein